jgi:hypothetical protein
MEEGSNILGKHIQQVVELINNQVKKLDNEVWQNYRGELIETIDITNSMKGCNIHK